MAANIVSSWVESRVGYSGGTLYKAVSTIAVATANTDAATKPTPRGLDVRRPWSLTISCSVTPDAQALPFEVWYGTADDFVMANGDGAGAMTATSGVFGKQLCDDIVLAVAALPYCFEFVPSNYPQALADIVTVAAIATGFRVRVPIMPYYAFNFNGGSTLAAETATFRILQG